MTGASIDPGIFKAYDVRGSTPPARRRGRPAVGRAFVDYLDARRIAWGGTAASPRRARRRLRRGARSQGAAVTTSGSWAPTSSTTTSPVTTSTGAIVTASTIRRSGTGSSWCAARARPLRRGGIREIARGDGAVAMRTPCLRRRAAPCHDGRGLRAPLSLLRRSLGDPAAEGRSRRANGMGRSAPRPSSSTSPSTRCACTSISTARSQSPRRPLLEENEGTSVERVRAERADLGIAWDGDADRCFFVDDAGEYVPGDFVTALLGEDFARREPGAKVVYDVRASRAVPTASAPPGPPLVNRVGHAFMKRRMRTRTPSSAARSRATSTSARTGMRTTDGPPSWCWRSWAASAGGSARSSPPPAALPHLRRDQLPGRRRRAGLARLASAIATGGSSGSTASPWTTTTGTSTSAVQHRAPAEAEPRGGEPTRHGAAPRRGARGHPRLRPARSP